MIADVTAVFTHLNHIYRREHRQSFGTYNNFTDAVPLQRGLFTGRCCNNKGRG